MTMPGGMAAILAAMAMTATGACWEARRRGRGRRRRRRGRLISESGHPSVTFDRDQSGASNSAVFARLLSGLRATSILSSTAMQKDADGFYTPAPPGMSCLYDRRMLLHAYSSSGEGEGKGKGKGGARRECRQYVRLRGGSIGSRYSPLRFPAADDNSDLIKSTFEVSVSATAFIRVNPFRDDRIPRSH